MSVSESAGDAIEVLEFWFEECTPAQWFRKDTGFDQRIGERFGHIHDAAARCELSEWRANARGRLAEILVLDQFSRNIYRDTARAFANDALALALAQEAITRGVDAELSDIEVSFVYMPFMHSESALIHEQALRLFARPGLEDNLRFEQRHKEIIDRFGRYPHRNAILGRQSSAEEKAFLSGPGSGF